MSEHDLESALVALMIFGAPVCGIGAFWAWRIARLRAGRRP
jgi:hypothetical protein